MKNKKSIIVIFIIVAIIISSGLGYYKFIHIPYQEAVTSFNSVKKSVLNKNKELENTIEEAKEIIAKNEEPLDENTLLELNNTISKADTELVKIPKMKDKTEDIQKQVEVLKQPIDYSTIIQELKLKLGNYTASVQQLKQVTNPPQEFIIERLEEIESITATQPVTEDNDPNGLLNKQGGYTATIYFNDNQTGQSISGNDLIEAGAEAGGSIEVYPTKDEAEKRNNYLSSFDGQGFLNPGSHYVHGTIVIRTSKNLTASQQQALTETIYHKLIEIKN